MSYYPTLDEDLARAKEILAKGKAAHDEVAYLQESVKAAALPGGAIYGADTYAAYKLLESFVAEIERLQREVRELKAKQPLSPGAFRHPTGFGT
jgi:hypothetical protein